MTNKEAFEVELRAILNHVKDIVCERNSDHIKRILKPGRG